MNRKEKLEILESLEDSRNGEREMNDHESYDALIYQGWVEALEHVIGLTGQSEKQMKKQVKYKEFKKKRDK